MKMSRCWAMPSPQTFSIPPIASFVARWMPAGVVSADPFARDGGLATYTNDLNPETKAQHHLDAADFCALLLGHGVALDVALFDPPYSPRQMSEVYAMAGISGVGPWVSQNARLYKEVRDGLDALLKPGGVALSFGWNSSGFGKGRGYEIEEILLVSHGGAHNDTICMAERKLQGGIL